MSRIFAALGTILFSVGTAAGLLLIVMETIDGNYRLAGSAAVGTVILAFIAWSFRRSWQCEKQAAAFRRESASR